MVCVHNCVATDLFHDCDKRVGVRTMVQVAAAGIDVHVALSTGADRQLYPCCLQLQLPR